jgi:hypothetical protein
MFRLEKSRKNKRENDTPIVSSSEARTNLTNLLQGVIDGDERPYIKVQFLKLKGARTKRVRYDQTQVSYYSQTHLSIAELVGDFIVREANL